eukprot:gene16952-21616_t
MFNNTAHKLLSFSVYRHNTITTATVLAVLATCPQIDNVFCDGSPCVSLPAVVKWATENRTRMMYIYTRLLNDNQVRLFMRGGMKGENMEWNHDYFVDVEAEEAKAKAAALAAAANGAPTHLLWNSATEVEVVDGPEATGNGGLMWNN